MFVTNTNPPSPASNKRRSTWSPNTPLKWSHWCSTRAPISSGSSTRRIRRSRSICRIRLSSMASTCSTCKTFASGSSARCILARRGRCLRATGSSTRRANCLNSWRTVLTGQTESLLVRLIGRSHLLIDLLSNLGPNGRLPLISWCCLPLARILSAKPSRPHLEQVKIRCSWIWSFT